MKRSPHMRKVTLGVAAISVFALAACREEVVPVNLVDDPAECASQPGMTFEICEEAALEAAATHMETAPRYDGQALCEEEHGVGNCEADPVAAQSGGGMGSIFMPMMMGYLLGNMMGGSRAAQAPDHRAAPLYPTANSSNVRTAGGASVNPGTFAGQMPANSFDRAPTTAGRPPMTQSQMRPMTQGNVQSTGGFGSRASGGFGG